MSTFQADLVGGPADGRCLKVAPENAHTILNVVWLDSPGFNPDGPTVTTYITLRYQRTGMRDDGRLIFSYLGYV